MHTSEKKTGEKRMRKATLLAASVLGLAGVSANADILISSTRTPGTGGNAGFDVVRFFAKFSPGGAEVQQGATGLSVVGITMDAAQPFKFNFSDQNVDGIPDWDPVRLNTTNGGVAASPLLDNANVGTFIATRPYDKPAAQQGGSLQTPNGLYAIYPDPAGANAGKNGPQQSNDVDGSGGLTPGDFDPKTVYQTPVLQAGSPGLKKFRVEEFNSFFDTSANPTDPNYARGALFAVAVIPTGVPVHIQGTQPPNFAGGGVTGDKGPQQDVNYTDPVPEPGTLALVGIAGMGLLSRRRRQA